MKRFALLVVGLLVMTSMLLSACQPQTQVVTQEVVVRETVVEEVITTVEVEVEVTPEVVRSDRTGAWLDTIVVVEEPSADAAVSRLETGDIDVYAFTVSNADVANRVASSPALRFERSYGSYNEITFNPAGPVLDNGQFNPFHFPKIREAMNYALDRNYIAQEIMRGLGVPRWTPFNTASTDYARLAAVAREIELKYAYDLDKAREMITEEMEANGATLEGGVWTYEGTPVEIIGLIRTEDERRIIGDYVATQLEDLGFTVVRDYKTAAEASPCWTGSDPMGGCFSYYTGGWITTSVPRDLGDNFDFFYTPRGIPWPLWQAYTPTEEFDRLAEELLNRDFDNLEERTAKMARALELAMEDSVRVWLVDRSAIAPMRAEVRVAADLYGSISGSRLWPYTLRRVGEEGGSMTVAMPSILTEPWNPLGGSNWVYDQMLIRGIGEYATNTDPFTGLMWPQRIERAEVVVEEGLPVGKTLDWVDLSFAPTIQVPEDAWADWDAETQTFITVGERFPEGVTAARKSVVYYPADLYDTVKWHDGSNFSVGDIILNMILTFDRGKEASPVFDQSQVGVVNSFLSAFKGVKIVSTDPLVIETYSDLWELDAEMNVSLWWPFYNFGQGSWHMLALGLKAEEDGEATFTSAKATELEVDRLNYISGPTLDIMAAKLAEATEESWIPYAPTLGQFVSEDEIADRYAKIAEWKRTRGHFYIGTGAYYLERAFPVEGTVVLRRFLDYPDMADKWERFSAPAIAVVEVDGDDRVTIGSEAVFDVFVTFQDAPYAVDDIDNVQYLVFDATGALAFTGQAEPVEDGLWEVVLSGDQTRGLAEGATRLEVVVVSKRVAVPSFDSFQFVTVP